LRRHGELVGLKSNFSILDTDDQLRLLKQLVRAEGIDEKRWPPKLLAAVISTWKNNALTPDALSASEAGAYNGKGPKLYALYQERLRTINACDFDDLLLHMVTIFRTHADVLAQYQRWFKYILVDEYQDTNTCQYLWLRLLAQGHKNICCVGDDDQSIYGWRGAEVGNILRFEKDFSGAKIVRLEQNYRSTPHILAAASAVISGNEDRLGKTLWTASEDGELVRLIGHWDGEEEARWIGDQIEDLVSGCAPEAKRRYNPRSGDWQQELDRRAKHGLGRPSRHAFVKNAFENDSAFSNFRIQRMLLKLLKEDKKSLNMYQSLLASPVDKFCLDEVAILVRASHQMRAFEDRFLNIGLPYRVIGGPRFYERMEIRDAMAYFRLVVQPEDDLAFERIINKPKRGVGDKSLQTIQLTARAQNVPLIEATRRLIEAGDIKGKAKTELAKFLVDYTRWHEQAAQDPQDHIALAETILDESGYMSMWANDKTPEAPGRVENLKELIKALEQFENLGGFLEHIALVMENEMSDQQVGEHEPIGRTAKVSIMTLHGSKGLEFPAVFLPGWEEGIFPSQRSMDESGLKGLEEERRLAYVGITRAEELCTISFAGNRRVFGQWQSQLPSRFIDELPADHVDVLTQPGLYGGGGARGSHETPHDMAARVSSADAYASPGWKRMQARARDRQTQTPKTNVVIDAKPVSSFTQGDRVFHAKFGYGYVMGIEGDKLDIEFEKAGSKKLIASFVVAAERAGDVPF
ncbi:MAG: ATP-dependent helicase, partial [Halocynthiibacter sp.]